MRRPPTRGGGPRRAPASRLATLATAMPVTSAISPKSSADAPSATRRSDGGTPNPAAGVAMAESRGSPGRVCAVSSTPSLASSCARVVSDRRRVTARYCDRSRWRRRWCARATPASRGIRGNEPHHADEAGRRHAADRHRVSVHAHGFADNRRATREALSPQRMADDRLGCSPGPVGLGARDRPAAGVRRSRVK